VVICAHSVIANMLFTAVVSKLCLLPLCVDVISIINGLLNYVYCHLVCNMSNPYCNRGMSGGEKSFTTMALLLAMQQNNESPFVLMDEFDVRVLIL
jgi:hypothetical protein